jgi:hypothetical protein
MKDTTYPLRKAYYSLISGLGYDCYDTKVPNNVNKPYIILGTQTSVEESTKNTFNYRCSITLDIYSGFTDFYSSRKGLDTIVNNILTALITSPGNCSFTLTDFDIFGTKKVIDNDFDPIVTDTQTIFRKVIIIEHLLKQK